jgi:hypothetical protein
MTAQIDLRTHTALQSCPRTTAYKDLCPRRQCILIIAEQNTSIESIAKCQRYIVERLADSELSPRLYIFSPRPHRVMTPPPGAESGLQSRVATRSLHHGCIYCFSHTLAQCPAPPPMAVYIRFPAHSVSPRGERGVAQPLTFSGLKKFN